MLLDKSFIIDFEFIRKLCGFSIKNDLMIELLNYLDIKVAKENDNRAKVTTIIGSKGSVKVGGQYMNEIEVNTIG